MKLLSLLSPNNPVTDYKFVLDAKHH